MKKTKTFKTTADVTVSDSEGNDVTLKPETELFCSGTSDKGIYFKIADGREFHFREYQQQFIKTKRSK